jgi:hypothetical protein
VIIISNIAQSKQAPPIDVNGAAKKLTAHNAPLNTKKIKNNNAIFVFLLLYDSKKEKEKISTTSKRLRLSLVPTQSTLALIRLPQ